MCSHTLCALQVLLLQIGNDQLFSFVSLIEQIVAVGMDGEVIGK